MPLRAYAYATRPIAVGNTSPCRPISLRSIRALATLLPHAGQYAPPLRLCARATPLRAYAYATRPYCRCQYGLPIALFRCAQYGLLLRYCPAWGAIRSAAPAMCSGYALARIRLRNPPYCHWQYGLLSPYFAALNTGFCRPIAVGNTGFCRPISLRSITTYILKYFLLNIPPCGRCATCRRTPRRFANLLPFSQEQGCLHQT